MGLHGSFGQNRRAAICQLLRPSAISPAISSCLRVSPLCGSPRAAGAGLGGRVPSTANATPSSIVIAWPRANAVSNDPWPRPRTATATDRSCCARNSSIKVRKLSSRTRLRCAKSG
jgi:hypothetical protein